MALKKPSDLFNKEESSVVFQSSEISSNITETYDRFRDNLDKVNVLSEQIEYLSQQLSEKMTRTDLENAMLSNLMVLDENFKSIRNQVGGLNKEDLKEFKVNVSNLTEIVGDLVETELPKYRKQITNNEVRISNQFTNFKEEIDERIEKFYEVLNEFNDVVQVIDTVSNIENYIQEHHQDLVNLREEVFCEIEKLPFGNLQENIERLEKKIDFIKETYSKIEPEIIVKEVIKEGLLNEPPETKNSDPLTPLDQNFVTLDQLQNHYRLFINRIQQQLSTLGGGGETQLKYLDDIVGIATNASAYDGKFLRYNHSISKFIFDTASNNNYWTQTPVGIHTLSNVGIGTTNPTTKLQVQGTTQIQTSVGSTQSVWNTTLDSKDYSAPRVSLLVQPETAYNNIDSEPVIFSHAIRSSGTSSPILRSFQNITTGAATSLNSRVNLYGFSNYVSRNSTTDISSSSTNSLTGIYNLITQGTNISESSRTSSIEGIYNVIYIDKGRVTNVYGNNSEIYVGTAISSVFSTRAYGSYNLLSVGSGPGIATLTDYYGYYLSPGVSDGGILTNYYGVYLETPYVAGTGTITNRYSIYSTDTSSPMYHAGSVGIGTTNPTSKLEVQGGDIKVGVNTSQGLILTSPNGTKYRLIVNDAGVLSTVSLP